MELVPTHTIIYLLETFSKTGYIIIKIELKPNSFARYESLFRDYKIYKIKLRERYTKTLKRTNQKRKKTNNLNS